MNIQFSAIAKRKIELLSIHLTIVWGEDELHLFLDKLEDALNKISMAPTSFNQFLHKHLYVYELSEDTSFVYLIKESKAIILTLFDNRQNPTIVYNDLIEHFS